MYFLETLFSNKYMENKLTLFSNTVLYENVKKYVVYCLLFGKLTFKIIFEHLFTPD